MIGPPRLESIQLWQATLPGGKGVVVPQIGEVGLTEGAQRAFFAVGQKDPPAAKVVFDQNALTPFQNTTGTEAVIGALGHEDKAGVLLHLEHWVIELKDPAGTAPPLEKNSKNKSFRLSAFW